MPSKDQNSKKNKAGDQKKAVEKRRKNQPFLYLFSFLLLVIIVVTFIGAPVVSRMASGGHIIFGSYGGRDIEYVPGNYLSRQRDMIADQIGQNGANTNVQYQMYQVWRGAFERTAFHTGVLEKAEKSGVFVTQSRVDQELTQYPGYMENGKFSEVRYRNTSNSEKYEIRKLTKRISSIRPIFRMKQRAR